MKTTLIFLLSMFAALTLKAQPLAYNNVSNSSLTTNQISRNLCTPEVVSLPRFNPLKPKQNPYDVSRQTLLHANSLLEPAKGFGNSLHRSTLGIKIQISIQSTGARLKSCWFGLWTSNEKRNFPFKKVRF